MTYSMEDLFGPAPQRPDHEDFWKLSEVLLRLDSMIDPDTYTQEQNDAAFKNLLADIGVDEKSLVYMAMQRAFRVCGVVTVADLVTKSEEVTKICSAWVDAFVAGSLYVKKGQT